MNEVFVFFELITFVYFSGYLIKIDVRHSSHLEKSQLTVTPPASGGKPIFSINIKDDKYLATYSFNRKVNFVF